MGGNGRMQEQTVKCPTKYCGKFSYALDRQNSFYEFYYHNIYIVLYSYYVQIYNSLCEGYISQRSKMEL